MRATIKTLIAVVALAATTVASEATLDICYRPLPSKKQIECLAANVYHEARGEPFLGQVLVARTTLNRVLHTAYPDSICAVVFQKHQFSWTLQTKRIVYNEESFAAAMAAFWHRDRGITHYHADSVKPRWARSLRREYRVGNHIFYSDKAVQRL